MILVNGEPGGLIHADDRGLQFGDGVFETLAVKGGRVLRWERHLARLAEGCERLRLPLPDPAQLATDRDRALQPGEDAVLKIIVTRGRGARGYRIPDVSSPTRIVSVHPWPDFPPANYLSGIALTVCRMRLGRNPVLAGLKHLNRLEQVLARSEWSDPAIAEGIMLDSDGHVVEGTMSNLFLVADGRLTTPALGACGVAGVMRAEVLTAAERLGLEAFEREIDMLKLVDADEIFMTNSLIGIWPVRRIDGPKARDFAIGPVTRALVAALDSGGALPPRPAA